MISVNPSIAVPPGAIVFTRILNRPSSDAALLACPIPPVFDAARAFAQADIALRDIDTAQFYDPFTIFIIMRHEHYGLCNSGHGGPFMTDGSVALNGKIPANTDGGQISRFYGAGFPLLSKP